MRAPQGPVMARLVTVCVMACLATGLPAEAATFGDFVLGGPFKPLNADRFWRCTFIGKGGHAREYRRLGIVTYRGFPAECRLRTEAGSIERVTYDVAGTYAKRLQVTFTKAYGAPSEDVRFRINREDRGYCRYMWHAPGHDVRYQFAAYEGPERHEGRPGVAYLSRLFRLGQDCVTVSDQRAHPNPDAF